MDTAVLARETKVAVALPAPMENEMPSESSIAATLFDKFVDKGAVLRTEYFGMSPAEIAGLMRAQAVGVFSQEFDEVRALAKRGKNPQACKLYCEIRGCDMSDAALAIQFLETVDR